MEQDEMQRRAASAPVARLATLTPDGRPHLVPICFVLDGDTLYTAVDAKPKRSRRLQRLANIRAHPDVSVLVDHYEDDWSRLWWVRLRGTASVIEGGPEAVHAITLLRAKYAQYRAEPPQGPVIAVAIDEWRGWDATEGGAA